MNTRYIWKNRPAMIRRGARIYHAHATNRLDSDQFAVWFRRNFSRYAMAVWGRNVQPTNLARLEKAFWRDAEKYVITEIYGRSWEEYIS